MDNKNLEKLHYNELKEIVKSYCKSGLGKRLIDKLIPSNNIKQVQRMLDETSEGRRLIDAGYNIPLEGVFDISTLLDKLEKGAVLEPAELTTINDFLRGCRKIKLFIKDKEGYAKTLSLYSENITKLEYIEEEINLCISGSIVDSNASKELKRIRKEINICEERIKDKLERFIKNPNNKEYLQDNFISQRNGRYTVPIKASYKNYVQGSIVETSSKGNTIFIEPSVIGKYTTELNSLNAEESIEEYKILSIISEMIYERSKELKVNIEVIAEYDMILAKAKYSKEIGGIAPDINDYGYINIKNASYPLIKNSVPLNFRIGDDFRTLIITGPNAGGKTVVLKTIGLLTLAVQSGFHIRVSSGSEIAIFEKIFVAIGDNQSIENSLSTFSSHIKNISEILKESNKNTLLLFDEIGSGTEPNEGAALAIAILEEFYHKGCITVATTHYGEIKNFSKNHPDFENAAMEFKKETLEPLYKLSIGKSGNSNALYISRKMGINEIIIKRSKEYMENKNYNYVLVDRSKVNKKKTYEHKAEKQYEYNVGDKVLLLDKNLSGIVYKTRDEFNNIIVLLNKEFVEVNFKRVKLEIKAEELYPEGYDLNQLFVSFKERKFEKDIERGSKKALKKLKKNKELKFD
ncbi:MAG: endonuclease MutS2 [Clostridium butyricum]|nr:endonuclease MutS2 [Clostridium butyricum]